MAAQEFHAEDGFGLIELLISMVVLQVALLAILGAFSAGSVALGKAGHVNTAAVLADQQMELYRTMPYDAIGLNTAAAPTSGTYIGDTSVCPSSQTPVCGNTAPRNNSGSGSNWDDCTTAGQLTVPKSVSTFFTANGANPCTAHRSVSGASSPDRHTYAVDTYISWGSAANQRAVKTVSVVVRDGTTATELAKEVTTFDCSTGNPYGAAPC